MSAAVPATPTRGSSFTELAWRVLTLVNLFRLLVPLLLMVLYLTVPGAPVGHIHPALFVATTTGYFLFAAGSISSLKRRWPSADVQTIINVCIDVIAVALLTYASGGMGSGLAALLVLPIGAASLVVRQRLALMFAAVAAITILIEQTFTVFDRSLDPSDFTAAGIVGALMFVISLGVTPLARSLRESEALVRQRDVDIANLAELNEFIVQHLRESILVVDESDRIRLINESAAQLLKGAAIAPEAQLREISPRLLHLLELWRRNSYEWQMSTTSLVSSDGGALIQPHFVALEKHNAGPTLIFLEDTSAIAERVQQSKLAALGRLSASIAHEIRNPVGAMSHAAQLLREAPSLSQQEQRLTEIIEKNGERVSSIIENVLQLSRRDTTRVERIDLNAWLGTFMTEFRQTMQTDEHRLLCVRSDDQLDVGVDPSHLHQLLWNLSENALKYGLPTAGRAPVEVRTGRVLASGRPYLEVADRGPGIATEDSERIFEPFFTSNSGGTGLGLFIARELAQCNRAVLSYEPRSGGGSIFRVVFADPQRWEN
jgi:two-component system, NtrC family, sensor histidine kinase PilS